MDFRFLGNGDGPSWAPHRSPGFVQRRIALSPVSIGVLTGFRSPFSRRRKSNRFARRMLIGFA
jgi:hypothetical protein